MSDREVYKALGCCKRNTCDACPYKKYTIYGCKGLLIEDAEKSLGRLIAELKDAKQWAGKREEVTNETECD